MSPLSAAVAAAFAARRRELGLSLEEVAERAGMHRTSLGLVERNKRSLTIDSAARVATALDLRLSAVLADAERQI
jgi:transcriptional regulator with XRE-family HTH domain